MKTCTKGLFQMHALIASLAFIMAGRVSAQTFTTLYSFTNGNDGANPDAGLILSGNSLYGTAYEGGSSGNGTVFAINANGTGFTNLHSFTAISGSFFTNGDGAYPSAGLMLCGSTLYGTASGGGPKSAGTVFAVNANGTGFTNLYSFTNGSDGAFPQAALILSGSTLYGTASGGTNGTGTVFAVNTNGTDFTNLHNFSASSGPLYTNSDGAGPDGGLMLLGDELYGTTYSGGTGGNGTVFAVNTNGTSFKNLHNFSASSGPLYATVTNTDGAYPQASLLLLANTLYGTAIQGGSSGNGTLFALNTNGSGFTNLHSFSVVSGPLSTNSDGANPHATLILLGDELYGTTSIGGPSGNGTVFAVNTNGTGFTSLYSFTNDSDGANPMDGLILSGNTLYGTTFSGGTGGNGTVYALALPLAQPGIASINLSGANLVLTGTDGQFGMTNYVLTSTNVATPLTQWTRVGTNVLSASGIFTITVTNAVDHNVRQRFYILQTQ